MYMFWKVNQETKEIKVEANSQELATEIQQIKNDLGKCSNILSQDQSNDTVISNNDERTIMSDSIQIMSERMKTTRIK